jgi:large subunit ribosomal protein L35
MKSHSGMGKRARMTGGGKVVKPQSNRVHNLQVKTSRRKRRLAGRVTVSNDDTRRIKKLLGR